MTREFMNLLCVIAISILQSLDKVASFVLIIEVALKYYYLLLYAPCNKV